MLIFMGIWEIRYEEKKMRLPRDGGTGGARGACECFCFFASLLKKHHAPPDSYILQGTIQISRNQEGWVGEVSQMITI